VLLLLLLLLVLPVFKGQHPTHPSLPTASALSASTKEIEQIRSYFFKNEKACSAWRSFIHEQTFCSSSSSMVCPKHASP
jgi:hypothetical protein